MSKKKNRSRKPVDAKELQRRANQSNAAKKPTMSVPQMISGFSSDVMAMVQSVSYLRTAVRNRLQMIYMLKEKNSEKYDKLDESIYNKFSEKVSTLEGLVSSLTAALGAMEDASSMKDTMELFGTHIFILGDVQNEFATVSQEMIELEQRFKIDLDSVESDLEVIKADLESVVFVPDEKEVMEEISHPQISEEEVKMAEVNAPINGELKEPEYTREIEIPVSAEQLADLGITPDVPPVAHDASVQE